MVVIGTEVLAAAGRSVASPSGRSSTTMPRGWRALAARSSRSLHGASCIRPGGKGGQPIPPAPHGGGSALGAPCIGTCAPVLAQKCAAPSALTRAVASLRQPAVGEKAAARSCCPESFPSEREGAGVAVHAVRIVRLVVPACQALSSSRLLTGCVT